ncbi:MAG: hypothetical protein ABIS59_03490 [Candidatus Saccharibacteria bacterium]
MKRGQILIPKSELSQQLEQAAIIRIQMTKLLRELEESATGTKSDIVGLWRHDPISWLKLRKPKP